MPDTLRSLSRVMIPAVEQEMRAVLRVNGTKPDLFYGMMHYHLGWVDHDLEPIQTSAGKRIRPLFCLLTCQAAGGDWQQAVPAAAAIELIHNFTLIHDDIQDGSPLRRGRPTLWTVWGMPQAINSGDAMFALAHLALNRLVERGVRAEIVVRALQRLDETCIKLTIGQHADIDFEKRAQVSVDEYMAMINGKTAALIALSGELGALIAGRDSETVRHYATFGRDLGLTFQVLDDILGIWGEESVIGKSAATDIETKKKSLPVLYSLEQESSLRDLYHQDPAPPDFVSQVVTLLDKSSARQYAEEKASHYSQSALSHLEAAEPQEPGYTALRQLADALLKRQA